MTLIIIPTFREIEGYENLYWINQDGDVKNKHDKFLKTRDNGNGYNIIDLSKDGIKKTFSVHRLVGLTFLEKNENYPDIDHIDGDRKNNNITNLRFVDRSGNNRNTKRKNQTGYRGVCFCKNIERFKAQIRIDGKKKHLGVFSTPEEASKKYEEVYEEVMSVY
tara:strand:+ start:1100 stop:1588 length:489 start_codon:yes stop_codon:yes gene_type:complete